MASRWGFGAMGLRFFGLGTLGFLGFWGTPKQPIIVKEKKDPATCGEAQG